MKLPSSLMYSSKSPKSQIIYSRSHQAKIISHLFYSISHLINCHALYFSSHQKVILWGMFECHPTDYWVASRSMVPQRPNPVTPLYHKWVPIRSCSSTTSESQSSHAVVPQVSPNTVTPQYRRWLPIRSCWGTAGESQSGHAAVPRVIPIPVMQRYRR